MPNWCASPIPPILSNDLSLALWKNPSTFAVNVHKISHGAYVAPKSVSMIGGLTRK